MQRLYIRDGEVGQGAQRLDNFGDGGLLIGVQVELDACRAVSRLGVQLMQRHARLTRVDLGHHCAEQPIVVERAHVDARDGRQARTQPPL